KSWQTRSKGEIARRRSSAALRTIFLLRRRIPRFQPLAARNDFEIGSKQLPLPTEKRIQALCRTVKNS
ncbi:MAG TPA: hypothetical protein VN328_06390, partial [Thermodesulfovibrionales bacterium]|nr:hypothetical protein [Thermodesulfovibrionales bacterium]